MSLQASDPRTVTKAVISHQDQLSTHIPARIRHRSVKEHDSALHCDIILRQSKVATTRTNEGFTRGRDISQYEYQQQFVDDLVGYLESNWGQHSADSSRFIVLVAWRDGNERLQTRSILPPRHRSNDHSKLVDEWKEMSNELPSAT
ncbi:hypothetical protein VNI00_016407 [Paramarasmius palmivorus]|uniref:Uncharacterized protein n=1 Tax=Paramarasmius palmivorus TaxID=297713 RepID=A0AAW0BEV7_9AGAR